MAVTWCSQALPQQWAVSQDVYCQLTLFSSYCEFHRTRSHRKWRSTQLLKTGITLNGNLVVRVPLSLLRSLNKPRAHILIHAAHSYVPLQGKWSSTERLEAWDREIALNDPHYPRETRTHPFKGREDPGWGYDCENWDWVWLQDRGHQPRSTDCL